MNTINLQEITTDHVRSVYSGKPGCACGCRGNHKVNPIHRAEANEENGYECAAGDVSAASVASVLRKVLAGGDAVEIADDGTHVSLETETRLYIVYLCNGVRVAGREPLAA